VSGDGGVVELTYAMPFEVAAMRKAILLFFGSVFGVRVDGRMTLLNDVVLVNISRE
jgi:hypothetical protein